MKATGIVRNVDELGRLVLPVELRRTLDIGEKGALEIFTEGNTIILRKYQPGCFKCGQVNGLLSVDGILICRECAARLSEKLKEVNA